MGWLAAAPQYINRKDIESRFLPPTPLKMSQKTQTKFISIYPKIENVHILKLVFTAGIRMQYSYLRWTPFCESTLWSFESEKSFEAYWEKIDRLYYIQRDLNDTAKTFTLIGRVQDEDPRPAYFMLSIKGNFVRDDNTFKGRGIMFMCVDPNLFWKTVNASNKYPMEAIREFMFKNDKITLDDDDDDGDGGDGAPHSLKYMCYQIFDKHPILNSIVHKLPLILITGVNRFKQERKARQVYGSMEVMLQRLPL